MNLPVGQNLQDHIMANIGPFTLETPGASFALNRDFKIETITDYFRNHSGLLSTPMTSNGVAYIYSPTTLERMKTLNTTPAETSPDLQLLLMPSSPAMAETFEKLGSIQPGILKKYFGDAAKKDGFFINVMLSKYQSRGEIKLASANPNDKPIMDPKYFSHPGDIKRIVEGINFTVTMVESSKAFQKHGARLLDTHLPGCEMHPLRTMAYYECYARHLTLTVYHQCGTCTMGKGVQDPKAVVDSSLR